MSHIYISYSREDHDFVDIIEPDLIAQGHPVWRDTSSIERGRDWSEAIEAALRDAYALVVVLSEKSLSNEWVKREVEFARLNDIPIVPAQVETCTIPKELSNVEVANFWRGREAEGFEQVRFYRQALQQLMNVLDQTRPALLYMRQLKDPDDGVRENAATKLGELEDGSATEDLIQLLTDQDEGVRCAAAEALGKLKSEPALKSLVRALGDKDPDVCAAAAEALGCIGLAEAVGPLIERLDHSDRYVRASAAKALGALAAVEAVKPLISLVRNDPISDVRQEAGLALSAIGGPIAERALRRVRPSIGEN